MGASLDNNQQKLILTVTSCMTALVLGFVIVAETFVIPRLAKTVSANGDISKSIHNANVLGGCFQTFVWMAIATFVVTWPITQMINPHEKQDAASDISSSINFCEADFKHTSYIAEPANTISSILSYCPLAIAGLVESFSRNYKARYNICYFTVNMIGIGSTLLHAFLTAVTQGGDELPMLWYTAAVGFCGFDVIFPGVWGLKSVVALTSVASTIVYIQFRESFTYFYIMFSIYCTTLILSHIYVSLFMDWERRPQGAEFKYHVLLPLGRSCALLVVAAMWVWVSEMSQCGYAVSQKEQSWIFLIWNRVLHPVWHFLTAILAFMVIQVFHASEGFARGCGMPHIVWCGVPFVVFPEVGKHEKQS